MSQNTAYIQGSGIALNTANTSNGAVIAYPTNARGIVDANFVVTIALASGASNVNTNALDLGDGVSGVPYATTETINVQLALSASNNGNATNAATAIGYLEHTSANTDGTPNAAAWAVIPTTGAYNWGFVAGKTQTQYPWDSWQKQYTSEPPVWFHEILRPDGTAYRAEEVELIRQLTGKK